MLESDQDEVFLEYYSREWNDYHKSSVMLIRNNMYIYLEMANGEKKFVRVSESYY